MAERRAGARSQAIGVLLALTAATLTLGLLHGTMWAVLAAVGITFAAAGSGLACAVDLPNGPRRPAIILLASITWSTLVSMVTSALTLTHPAAITALLVAPAALGATLGWFRHAGSATPRPHRPAMPGRGDILALAALVAALGMAGTATWHASARAVGEFGLLPILGWPYFVAVGLAVGVIIAATAPVRTSHWVGILGLVGLLGLFTLPPAVIADHMLAGWSYKHLGVVERIVQGLPLDDPGDLLQAWPGFFALAANVASMSGGVDAVRYAGYASFLMLGLAGVALFSLARQYRPRSPAVAILATALLICTVWSNQFYYAPQSLAFATALLLFAVIYPLLVGAGPGSRRDTLRFRLLGWATRDMPWVPLDRRDSRRTGLLGIAGFLAIVVMHQLTPVVILVSFAPFVLLGLVSAGTTLSYVCCGMLAVAYQFWHRAALGSHPLFTGFEWTGLMGAATSSGVGSHEQSLASAVSRPIALLVLIATIGVIGFARRRFGRVLVPAVLAMAPGLLVLVQSYGGEMIYRVWLFSSPWSFLLIAAATVALRPRLRAIAQAALGLGLGLAILASAQASVFGMYPMLHVSEDEVDAAEWFYATAEPGSPLVLAATSFPARLSANYPLYRTGIGVNDPALLDDAALRGSALAAVSDTELATYVTNHWGEDAYLAIGHAMSEQSDYYGQTDPGVLSGLATRLQASPQWIVRFSTPNAVLLQVRKQ